MVLRHPPDGSITPARARDSLVVTPTSDAQVEEVFDLMVAGEWRTGKSHREMAIKWGVGVNIVHDRATEAARFIRVLAGKERDAIVGSLLAGVDNLVHLAQTKTKTYVNKNGDAVTVEEVDVSSALKGMELKAKLLRVLVDEEPAGLSEGRSIKLPKEDERRLLLQRVKEIDDEGKGGGE